MGKNPFINGAFGLPPNPYAFMYAQPTGPMPFPYPNGQPMKTPEQYKEELMRQVQPQLDQYAGLYQQTQAQAQMQANSGQYVKVSSYEEVKAVQTPADGRPIMVFDEVNGRLYSKRFEGGQVYIKGFALVPLDESPEAPKADKAEEPAPATPDKLDLILGRFDSLESRISALEGKKDGSI